MWKNFKYRPGQKVVTNIIGIEGVIESCYQACIGPEYLVRYNADGVISRSHFLEEELEIKLEVV